MIRFVVFKDYESDLEEIMGEQRACERSLNFTSSFVVLGNVLGHTPKTKISDWVDSTASHYPIRRVEALSFPKGIDIEEDTSESSHKDALAHVKHTEMETISIIRDSLWKQAGWHGVGFLMFPDALKPPFLVLLFHDIQAGKKIFDGWKMKLGDRDSSEEIRIAIIKGINRDHPSHYRVGIGSNIDALEKERVSNPKLILMKIRILVMTPSSLENLSNFEAFYNRLGSYVIIPGSIGSNGLEPLFEFGIRKNAVVIREAWQISLGDIDSVLIHPTEDKPIIPSGEEDAPVLEVLKDAKKWWDI
jgi:hypothetical protein